MNRLPRWGAGLLALILIIILGWCLPPDRTPVASAGPATPARSLVSLSEGRAAPLQVQQQQANPQLMNCVPASEVVSPTPTATSTATPTATSSTITPTVTPSPTITPTPNGLTPVPTETPVPTATPEGLQTGCVVSASPALAINPLGKTHTFTFLCGATAAHLPGPGPVAYPPGCFNVVASLVDISVGIAVNIDSATCGGRAAFPISGSVSCAGIQNPICAAGSGPSGGTCALICPAGFVSNPAGCVTPPVGGVCPAGSTAVRNSGGLILYCLGTAIPATTASNEATFTFTGGAPHAYLLNVTGFVGTTSSGTCPGGTVLEQNVILRPAVGPLPALVGPACAFTVAAEKKYAEANHLFVHPQGDCGEAATFSPNNVATPCFFTLTATGVVILKQGVNCTDGSEPATGTDATGLGFPPGSTYVCNSGFLAVDNIQIPRVPVNVTAQNGFFEPTCFPPDIFATPTPSPTPTASPNPLFPTLTPTPTSTLAAPTATAAPAAPATLVCGPPGVSSIQAFTEAANELPLTASYTAVAMQPVVPPGGVETIRGTFAVGGLPTAGVPMYAVFHFPASNRYCEVQTAPNGVAACSVSMPVVPPGTTVAVDVVFVYNCHQYTTTVTFVVAGPGTATPIPSAPTPVPVNTGVVPPGICVVRSDFGPLVVQASFTSTINTQPSISTGPVTLGLFTLATATPVATPFPTSAAPVPTDTFVPTVTPTNTPEPSPTPSPTPTPTETPTPVPTPTRTPTRTPTPIVLKYRIDGARVGRVNNPANLKGLDEVHRGNNVWLMLYYTVLSIPKTESGTSTYQIIQGNRTILSASYNFSVGPPPHSYTRFDPYTVPSDMPYGLYTFRASVKLDGKPSQSADWEFAVVRSPSQGP